MAKEEEDKNQFLLVFNLILALTVPIIICQENQQFPDFDNFTFYCNETNLTQFQDMIADKKAVRIEIQSCIESCRSVPEHLFARQATLGKLWLIFKQGMPDFSENICSSTEFKLSNATFKGLTLLQELYMKGFEKTVPDSGVFQPLQNLQILSLVRFGSERMNYEQLSKALTALSGSQLQHIELNGISDKYIQDNILDIEQLFQIQNVSIKSLAFDNNIVPEIKGRVSKALPDLQVASFSVSIRYASPVRFIVDTMISPRYLEELHIYSYPPEETSSLAYTKFTLKGFDPDILLKLFETRDESCYWNHKAPLSPKLRELRINGLRFIDNRTDGAKLCFKEGNVLKILDISESPLPTRLPLIQGLNGLTELHVRHTGIKSFSLEQLQNTPELKILDLGGNNLNEFLPNLKIDFNSSQNIEILNLTQCSLSKISENITTNLTSIQVLDLSKNNLQSADFFLENCTNLTILDMSGNQIEKLSPFSMAQFKMAAEQNRHFVLDLQRNPLSCLCNATEFIQWMQEIGKAHLIGYDSLLCLHPNGTQLPVRAVQVADVTYQCAVLNHIVQNAKCPCDLETLNNLTRIPAALVNYKCQNQNGKQVPLGGLDPDETFKSCLNFNVFTSPAFLVPIIAGLSLLTILGVAVIVLYRLKKQKKIDTLIPDCLSSNIIPMLMTLVYKKREPTSEFLYDVFVYFHDDDKSRIRQSLLHSLRNQVNMVTPDDFELGALKYEEIERCITKSRWIVFVISQTFVDDGWCTEAIVRSIQRQHAVIPVILGNLDLTDEELLSSLLQTNSPLYWPEESNQQTETVQSLLEKVKSDHNVNFKT